MKKILPKIILILIVGGLSYSNYLLRNSTDSTKFVDQFTRFLEKSEQLKENVNNEERNNELQLDIQEIRGSMEDQTELSDKISNIIYIIDISIFLCVLALYFMVKEKKDESIG
ncbi:hypothetical protein [Crocinitomix catalasitica]|uniref:hypothetical protein n=1 Tax=Crocinitomix catalasitica TaxID=184607 RepID=UPI000486A26F|nr:hypothetical protein [Crocinitomix catalasitica]